MRKEVYCKKCKFFVNRSFCKNCKHPSNIKYLYSDPITGMKNIEYEKEPEVINFNCKCSNFKTKIFSSNTGLIVYSFVFLFLTIFSIARTIFN